MEYGLNALVLMLENLAMIFFCDAFFERKRQGQSFWGIFFLVTLIEYAAAALLPARIGMIRILVGVSLLLLLNFALYHGAWPRRLLVVLSFYSCDSVLVLLIDNSILLLGRLSYEEFMRDRVLYLVALLFTYFLQISLAALLKRFRKPQNVQKVPWAGVTLMFPLVSLGAVVPLYSVMYQDEQSVPLLAGFSAALVAVNIGIVILIDWLEQNELMRQRSLAVSERLAAQQQNIEALSAAYAAQRKMTHDFRHHLDTLSGLLSQEAAPAAAQYVDALQRRQTERILAVNTHHAAIDAVLNQKALYAQKRGIDIQFEVNDLSALKVREIDCTVVLANLLDNAIEACAKLPQPERWIEVKALLEHAGAPGDTGTAEVAGAPGDTGAPKDVVAPGNRALFISVLNASPPVKIVGDHIDTTKEDPSLHGFGLPNVKEILAQNGAEYMMAYQNNTFQFSLEWPGAAH